MNQEVIKDFMRYAAAFEDAFAARDFGILGEHLAPDVDWILSGAPQGFGIMAAGKEAVLEAIQDSCESMDYRFDRRVPKVVDGPTAIPGGIHMTWRITFQRKDLSDFQLFGEEWDLFRNGKLESHRERIWNFGEAIKHVIDSGDRLRATSARKP